MTGGMIQLAASQSRSDYYLTGEPKITYFKQVYKKHSKFAIESFIIQMNDNPNFDKKSTTILPKIGDLLYRLYLQIDLPLIHIYNDNKYIDTNMLNQLYILQTKNKNLLDKYIIYFGYNFNIMNQLLSHLKTINCDWYTLNDIINSDMNKVIQQQILGMGLNLKNVINEYKIIFTEVEKVNYVGSDIKNDKLKEDIRKFIEDMKKYYKMEEGKVYKDLNDINEGIKNIGSKYEYFSWIKNVGFNLIKKCSIIIAGYTIVEIDTNYLNIWYSLHLTKQMKKVLNKMIGNNENLTRYDNKLKDKETLYIPIPFWFNQKNNVVPIISLTNNDVEFYVEFNTLNDCCYYNGDINIEGIYNLSNCNIIGEYIYVGKKERDMFIGNAQEYLVEGIQKLEMKNINLVKNSVDMDVMHPIKDMYWIIQENKIMRKYKLNNEYSMIYIHEIYEIIRTNTNINEYISNKYDNINVENLITIRFNNDSIENYYAINSMIIIKYSKYYDGIYRVIRSENNYVIIYVENGEYMEYPDYNDSFYGIIYNSDIISDKTNIIEEQYISLNGNNLTSKIDSKYFNYVEPYKRYRSSNLDGINVYSFSLNIDKEKEILQPSGSANFSDIKSKNIIYKIYDKYYNYLLRNNLEYDYILYITNYNILRIKEGLGKLVFSR